MLRAPACVRLPPTLKSLRDNEKFDSKGDNIRMLISPDEVFVLRSPSPFPLPRGEGILGGLFGFHLAYCVNAVLGVPSQICGRFASNLRFFAPPKWLISRLIAAN